MKSLRLLLFADCDRDCNLCCNKDFDLSSLPIEQDFAQYDEIMLTGGEPMLEPYIIEIASNKIKKQNKTARIYLYTAKADEPFKLMSLLTDYHIDGITFTLHAQKDLFYFEILLEKMKLFPGYIGRSDISLRLNVFKGVDISRLDVSEWKIQDNMIWIKDCPLPKNEVFKRFMKVSLND